MICACHSPSVSSEPNTWTARPTTSGMLCSAATAAVVSTLTSAPLAGWMVICGGLMLVIRPKIWGASGTRGGGGGGTTRGASVPPGPKMFRAAKLATKTLPFATTGTMLALPLGLGQEPAMDENTGGPGG